MQTTAEASIDRLAQEILEQGRRVVSIEADGLTSLASSLDFSFVAAVKALLSLKGRAIISGLGKSGHIAHKVAATFVSTGTSASFVHAADAAHGDMGMITRQDLAILLSNSGETAELMPIIQHCARLRVPLIGISAAPASTLMRSATIPLAIPSVPEACPVGVAPTTSTTMMLALGDALAMAVMNERGFSRDDFRLFHPGGNIGLRLMKVSEIMHRGDRLPLVRPDTAMSEVVMTMTSKSFGIAGVVDAKNRLVGVITDGDLRRHLDLLMSAKAQQVMTSNPQVIAMSTTAEDALRHLNHAKVTALFVTSDDPSEERTPIGIVNVHDFLRLGLS